MTGQRAGGQEAGTVRLIVSRHPAAVKFIQQEAPEFISAPVVAHATPEDVRGKVVAGNLPLGLASLAAYVVVIEFAGAPPRGQEYGLDEMRSAGASLRRYRVDEMSAAGS